MSDALKVESQEPELIKFSNVCVVRDENNKLSVWVEGVKVMGATNISLTPAQDGTHFLAFAVTRFRVAEREPLKVVYEAPTNVLPFHLNTGNDAA